MTNGNLGRVVWFATALAALASRSSLASPSPAIITPTDQSNFQRIVGVADQVCKSPEMFGYTRGASGELGGKLSLEKLLRGLANAGISASLKGNYDDWRGILQKDAATSLTARNQCSQTIFLHMFDTFYLTSIQHNQPIQRPKHPQSAYRAARVGTAVNDVNRHDQSAGNESTSSAAGDHAVNSPTETQQEINAPLSGSHNGNILSNGSHMDTYNFAPPVNEQQEAEARLSLKSELGEFADFPDRISTSDPMTTLEQIISAKRSWHLYKILEKYYKSTITSEPIMGTELYDFKKKYYDFEGTEGNFETQILDEIGPKSVTKIAAGWNIYLTYYLCRNLGLTKDQIQSQPTFLNFGITIDEAERVYQLLDQNPQLKTGLATQLARLSAIQADTQKIVSAYKSE